MRELNPQLCNFLAAALPTGDEAKGLAVLAVFPLLGGGLLETGLSLVAMAVFLPALLMMSLVALVMMSLVDAASSSAGVSGAGVGRSAGVGGWYMQLKSF